MSLMYDATGVQESFKVTETFVLFSENQVVRLANAAYFKVFDDAGNEPLRPDGTTFSLVVRTLTQEDTVVTRSDPIPQVDPTTGTFQLWEPVVDQSDDQAKSDLLLHCNNAPESVELCNFIKFNKLYKGEKIRVEVTYQRYKKPVYDETPESFDGQGPRYSPAMMQNVLDRLDGLEAKPTSFANMFGAYLGNDDILEEDLTGLAPENFVRYEKHDVNTPSGITVVMPAKGAFYPDGLEILRMEKIPFTLTEETKAEAFGKLFFYTDTTVTLNPQYHLSVERKNVLNAATIHELLEKFGGSVTGQLVDLTNTEVVRLKQDVDYIFDDIDMSRTARTSSSSPVYRHIRFLTEVSGEVIVSYHAFGGFASTADLRSMHQDVSNTREILSNTGLLTEAGLAKLPLMVQIIKRLRIIEQYHNHFHSVEHRILVKGAKGIHWFNVAAIYDVDWGLILNNIQDLGHFRIHSMLRDWTYEFMVDVDVTRPIRDALQVKVLATNQSNYDITDGCDKIFKRDDLLARICWVDEGERSGVVLQLGWDLSVYDKEHYPSDIDCVTISNKSGSTSFWNLLTGDEVNNPAEGRIMVYNHNAFALTTDEKFVEGKTYYVYRNRYLYFRTCDKFIKEGRAYYSVQADGTYADATDTVVPGTPIEEFLDEEGRVTLYERIVHGNFLTVADVIPGEEVPYNMFYEADVDVYKEDKAFTMPNTNFVWNIEDPVHSKYAVKPLACDDGVVVWIGNVNLKDYCEKIGECKKCESADYDAAPAEDVEVAPFTARSGLLLEYQKLLDIRTAKSIDMIIFDRVENKFITCSSCSSLAASANGDGVEESITCAHLLAANDQCWATLQVLKENDVVAVKVTPYLGTFSLVNNRFDLRQIRLHY